MINQIDIQGKVTTGPRAVAHVPGRGLNLRLRPGAAADPRRAELGPAPLYGLTATAKVGLLAGEHNARVQPQFPTMLGQISKGNKRARILRELAMHTSAKFSGGANGLRMDYFSLLRQRLTQPLVDKPPVSRRCA